MSDETTTKPGLGLKPAEILAGAGAAVITAFASSFLGTAGTLTGAALASIVATVSTSLLKTSAERSKEKLRRANELLRTRAAGPSGPGGPGGPGWSGGGPRPDPAGSGPAGGRFRLTPTRVVALAGGALVVFVLAMTAITGVESVMGQPLASLFGQDTGARTTLEQSVSGGSESTEVDPGRQPGQQPGLDSSSPAPDDPADQPTDPGRTAGSPDGDSSPVPQDSGPAEPPADPPTEPDAPAGTGGP